MGKTVSEALRMPYGAKRREAILSAMVNSESDFGSQLFIWNKSILKDPDLKKLKKKGILKNNRWSRQSGGRSYLEIDYEAQHHSVNRLAGQSRRVR